MSRPNRLRGQEVAALERALESERSSSRAAQERCRELQQALDSERSAVRALKREATALAKTIREEEAKKYAILADQLRTKLELAQREVSAEERESTTRKLTAQFSRELQARQEEWRKEARRQVESLQEQLKQAQRASLETSTHSATDALVHSLHVDFQRDLNQRQEQWRRETRAQVEALTTQLRELQQLYTDTCNKLTTTTNEAENIPTLRQEIQALKLQNKELEEKNQMLIEMEKRRVEEFRMQHEEHASRMAQFQRMARKETLQLLEELKHKERQLGRHQRRSMSPVCPRPSPPRDRTKRRAHEGRKPPDPPRPSTTSDENYESNLSSKEAVNNWTKKVGLDTLYQLLIEEHQELRRTHLNTMARLKEEEHQRMVLEEQLAESRRNKDTNSINVALAEQIQALQVRQAQLEGEAQDLREQNDLLEFRILELDDNSFHFKTPSSRSPENRDTEMDDISDSGVMSLPTSEDISEYDFQDIKMEPNNKDVKSKLTQLCQSLEDVSERISIQQTLALLRHYEMRLESLESTLAVMYQESSQNKPYDPLPSSALDHSKSPRVVATVLPFKELSSPFNAQDLHDDTQPKQVFKDKDYMQESGIFEESGLINCVNHIGTQTDWTFDPPPGALGAEIRKLTRIRERIEEEGGNKKLLKSTEMDPGFLKNTSLAFYKERVQILEDKLAIYESSGDEQSKLLATRLEKEVLLAAQVKNLEQTLMYLKKENQRLEEEKCEFEEAENDTRLRCQKLEVKLSALGEKKSDLQVQLQQNARTMSNLRSTIFEEERKRNEARQYAAKMEGLVHRLEQQNFELEEKEMDVRYRLHTLENIVPAMVMYYLWRMLNAVRPFVKNNCRPLAIHSSSSDSVLVLKPVHRTEKHEQSLRKFKLPSVPQENLRDSFEEVEQFLSLSQEGEIFKAPGISTSRATTLIAELSNNCHILEERIKALEIKEKVYQETLQKGDYILNKMEIDYKEQLKSLEEELFHKQTKLEKAESQLRKCAIQNDLELQMQERLNYLETELIKLKDALTQKEKENNTLECEKLSLSIELEGINEINKKLKESIRKLHGEEENYKKRIKELLGDLDIKEQEKNDNDEFHHKIVSELKKINNQACRELEESEVTISELKEEVQTLEREVEDLRLALCHAKDSKERLLIQVGAELEEKEQQIRSLCRDGLAGSLHEELLELVLAPDERQVDNKSTRDVPASTTTSRQTDVKYDIPGSSDEKEIYSENYTSEVPRYTGKDKSHSSLAVATNMQSSGVCQEVGGSVTTLRWTVYSLISKCRVKDHMIRCLADQMCSCPWLVNDLFIHLSNDPSHTIDFNRIVLHEYICNTNNPVFSGFLEDVNDPGYSSAHPLVLKVVDQPDPLSLLVAWTSPSSNFVVGFQIVVEEQICQRIYSAARSTTILHPVNLQRPVTLTISAFQKSGQIVQENSIRYPP